MSYKNFPLAIFWHSPAVWPFKFRLQAPWAAHPQKKFSQNFEKILGDGASFSSALHGDPQGTSGIKFWQLYLGPFWQEKNSEISPKIDDFSGYKN